MQSLGLLQAIGLLIIATVLEVSGDATIRIALHNHGGLTAARVRIIPGGRGAGVWLWHILELGSPREFGEVVGLYIATLFIVWQIINFALVSSLPTVPILVGGTFIVIGGAVVSFWKA